MKLCCLALAMAVSTLQAQTKGTAHAAGNSVSNKSPYSEVFKRAASEAMDSILDIDPGASEIEFALEKVEAKREIRQATSLIENHDEDVIGGKLLQLLKIRLQGRTRSIAGIEGSANESLEIYKQLRTALGIDREN